MEQPLFSVDITSAEKDKEVMNQLNGLLSDAVLREVKSSPNTITFKINRKMSDKWVESELIIADFMDFYYRRFQTGMQRRGLTNLRRLRSKGQEEVEHISEISYWRHNLRAVDGFQILLYSGTMLRIIGFKIVIQINDVGVTENLYITPEKIQTPLTKLLYNPEKMIKRTREVIERITKSVTDVKVDPLDYEVEEDGRDQSPLTKKIIEFSDSIKEDNLTDEQQQKAFDIISRIEKQKDDLDRNEPAGELDILTFDSSTLRSLAADKFSFSSFDLFRVPQVSIRYSLEQIEAFNNELNAVVTLSPITENYKVGPLSNVSILIKDTIKTRGLRTSAGSQKYDTVPQEDAEVIIRLKESGAVILGKTNTPERVLDVQTFNSIFGTTNNPWNLNLTSGGSSGGSAAAIMANMATVALGTDLAGSLRIPASFCGVVSFRPTPGRISVEGQIPAFKTEGLPPKTLEMAIGPIAKNVYWVERVLSVLCYEWRVLEDQMQIRSMLSPELWFIKTDERIGSTLRTFQKSLDLIDGFTVELFEPELNYKNLIRAQTILSQYALGEQISEENLKLALDEQKKGRELIKSYFEIYDIWILPVSPVLPYPHNLNHEPILIQKEKVSYWKATISYCSWLSVLGNPVLTIPVAIIDGLPFGVQVIGKFGQDEELVAICRTLEKLIQINFNK